MEITKHFQSAVVLAKDDGGRLAVDLGARPDRPHDLDALGSIDAALFTHRHPDHMDPEVVDGLLERDVPVYGNADVCEALGDRPVTRIDAGSPVQIAGWEVAPHDIPHVVMVDGSPGPPNTGFVFDGRLLHPGDGLDLDGVRAEILALPIAGPSISFRDAYRMVERIGPRVAVPIHYDFFIAQPEMFASRCEIAEVVVLDHGESATL